MIRLANDVTAKQLIESYDSARSKIRECDVAIKNTDSMSEISRLRVRRRSLASISDQMMERMREWSVRDSISMTDDSIDSIVLPYDTTKYVTDYLSKRADSIRRMPEDILKSVAYIKYGYQKTKIDNDLLMSLLVGVMEEKSVSDISRETSVPESDITKMLKNIESRIDQYSNDHNNILAFLTDSDNIIELMKSGYISVINSNNITILVDALLGVKEYDTLTKVGSTLSAMSSNRSKSEQILRAHGILADGEKCKDIYDSVCISLSLIDIICNHADIDIISKNMFNDSEEYYQKLKKFFNDNNISEKPSDIDNFIEVIKSVYKYSNRSETTVSDICKDTGIVTREVYRVIIDIIPNAIEAAKKYITIKED